MDNIYKHKRKCKLIPYCALPERYVQFKDLRVKMSFIFRIKGVMEIGNAFKSFSEIPFKLELVDVWTSIKTWRNYGIIMTKSSVIKALPIEIGES